MSRSAAFGLAIAFAVCAATAMAAKPARKELVLIGTVTVINEIREEFSVDHLVVTVSVDKVLSGNLTDKTFTFTLPAIAKARLELRAIYEICAKRSGDSYVVREVDIRQLRTAPGAEPPSKDLLLVARVTAIKTADTGDLRRQWVVSTKVDKVVAGDLAGRAFQFAIHSPAQAGLKVGKTYTIPARWTEDGYVVEELDVWRHNH